MRDTNGHTGGSPEAQPRQTFIKQTAAAATGLVIVPRAVLGGRGYMPPSDKLNVASVGAGGMAASDIKDCSTENIVAFCDVDWKSAAKTFAAFPKATRYKNFRIMLKKERKNIDAVIVATPDHTHAVAAVAAIKMGKHVYCEKPLCKTIHETRLLMEEARKAKVATQVGNQGHSGEGMKLMCEWIWDGAIGAVREVDVWTTHAVWPQEMVSRPALRPCRKHSTGTSGWARHPRVPTALLTRLYSGADGGISGPAPSATWPATTWIP